MRKEIKINELSEFDMAQYIKSDADIVEYLSQVLEEGDSGGVAAALGHTAKVRGMTEIDRASGIKCEALYKALRGPPVILGSTRYSELVKLLA